MKKIPWPTMHEQLAVSKVAHGSALEKLIQENQEVHLLRPDESEDDLVGLPLWFRVYWRKQHPNEKNSSGSPVGDYPDVSNKILLWMISNQDLPPDPLLWHSIKKNNKKAD
jgi:hypothetical protein